MECELENDTLARFLHSKGSERANETMIQNVSSWGEKVWNSSGDAQVQPGRQVAQGAPPRVSASRGRPPAGSGAERCGQGCGGPRDAGVPGLRGVPSRGSPRGWKSTLGKCALGSPRRVLALRFRRAEEEGGRAQRASGERPPADPTGGTSRLDRGGGDPTPPAPHPLGLQRRPAEASGGAWFNQPDSGAIGVPQPRRSKQRSRRDGHDQSPSLTPLRAGAGGADPGDGGCFPAVCCVRLSPRREPAMIFHLDLRVKRVRQLGAGS